MKFISVLSPEGKIFNWNNARYKAPVTVILENDKLLPRLELLLKSNNFNYYINTRWKLKKKPKCIRQVNINTFEEIYYKKKEFHKKIHHSWDSE